MKIIEAITGADDVPKASTSAVFPTRMTKPASSKFFNTSPDIVRMAVLLNLRFPLSLRNVEDFLHKRGMDARHESVRYW